MRISLRFLCLLLGMSGLWAQPALSNAASPAATISLPADAAMHPSAETEWWYVVGHLHDRAGHAFGYEIVTFKFANLKRYVASATTTTVYRTDVALTDEHNHRFVSSVTYLAPHPPATRMSTAHLNVRAGAASFQQSGSGAYHFAEQMTGVTLSVSALPVRPPLLVGGTGVVPMGTQGSSYYYSLTRLTTTGTLTYGGATVPVSGISWMDHQWGTWDWRGLVGWDWMALQLDQGLDLNLSQFTRGHARLKIVTYQPQGSPHALVQPATLDVLGHWVSPVSHIRYPAGWRVRVPALKLDVVVTPTVAGQEMVNTFAKQQSYWEGSCTVRGTLAGKPISGLAYTELVGYGASLAAGASSGGI